MQRDCKLCGRRGKYLSGARRPWMAGAGVCAQCEYAFERWTRRNGVGAALNKPRINQELFNAYLGWRLNRNIQIKRERKRREAHPCDVCSRKGLAGELIPDVGPRFKCLPAVTLCAQHRDRFEHLLMRFRKADEIAAGVEPTRSLAEIKYAPSRYAQEARHLYHRLKKWPKTERQRMAA